MSFILDALRKSEQERQRHQSPGMADLRARKRTAGRPYWLPLVIFLVGINLGLLIFLWLNGTPPANPPVAETLAADPDTANAVPESATTVSAASADPLTPTGSASTSADMPAVEAAPVVTKAVVTDQAQRSLSSELAPSQVPEVEPTAAPASNRAAPVPQTAPSYGNLPTLTELTLAGTMSLAPLRIDMHVYSPQPAERFVFINMNKYREGESLREGPALTTITPDGVILDYQGRSFLVTRE